MKKNYIKNPRITEKASNLYEGNVYTFDVSKDATKPEIEKEIFAIYKVHPEKVRVVNIKPKKVQSRNMRGKRGGGKKVYVYLKEGDKINIL